MDISNRNTVSIRHAAARIMPLQTDQYIRHDSNAPGISAANLVEYDDLRAAEAHPAVRADRASRTEGPTFNPARFNLTLKALFVQGKSHL